MPLGFTEVRKKGKVVAFRLSKKAKSILPRPKTPRQIVNTEAQIQTKRFAKLREKVDENIREIAHYIEGMGIWSGAIGEDIRQRLEENSRKIDLMRAGIESLDDYAKRVYRSGMPINLFRKIRALKSNFNNLIRRESEFIEKYGNKLPKIND
jgi:hypothetical protein